MFAILNIRTTFRGRRVYNVKQANHIHYNNLTSALITFLRSISRVSKNKKINTLGFMNIFLYIYFIPQMYSQIRRIFSCIAVLLNGLKTNNINIKIG